MTFHGLKFNICISVIMLCWLFQGCDKLDEDQLPDTEITDSESESFLRSGTTAVIDIASGVKSNEKVKLNVSTRPSHGQLESLQGSLLKYKPNSSFTGGKDSFSVEIKSEENELLAVKTIQITVNPDSTKLPCTLIAFGDFATTALGEAVTIDVLKNDWDCDDVPINPNSVELIYNPTNGEAIVVEGKIKYTPNPSFSGKDELAYSVSSMDGEVSSQAFVQVLVNSEDSVEICTVNLVDDEIIVPNDIKVVNIAALDNDHLCNHSIESVSVSVPPEYGEVRPILNDNDQWLFEYNVIDSDMGITRVSDSFVYQVCDSVACYEASVFILFDQCALIANDDSFVLDPDSSFSQSYIYDLDVLQNDIFCLTDSLQLRIISGPFKGRGVVEDLKIVYATDSIFSAPDSLVYEVCQGNSKCDRANVNITFR